MPALVDNSARGFSATPATTQSTGAFTIGGTNRVLYVCVGSGAGDPDVPTSVKWNGTEDLVQIGTTINLGIFNDFSVWRLINPSAVNSTVDVVWPAAQDERLVIAVSVKDADQATPNGTVTQNTGASSPITVNVTTVAGDLTLDFPFLADSAPSNLTITADASQSSKQEIEGADTGFQAMGASTETASGVSTTMSWTISATPAHGWGTFAMAINGAVLAPRHRMRSPVQFG